jgi:hypothetical protein
VGLVVIDARSKPRMRVAVRLLRDLSATPLRLKTGADLPGSKQRFGRAEFFALPSEKRLEFAELRQGLAGVDQLSR